MENKHTNFVLVGLRMKEFVLARPVVLSCHFVFFIFLSPVFFPLVLDSVGARVLGAPVIPFSPVFVFRETIGQNFLPGPLQGLRVTLKNGTGRFPLPVGNFLSFNFPQGLLFFLLLSRLRILLTLSFLFKHALIFVYTLFLFPFLSRASSFRLSHLTSSQRIYGN